MTSVENSAAESSKDYIHECIRTVYAAFLRDHPEVFWLGWLGSQSYSWNGRTYFMLILSASSTASGSYYDMRKPEFQPGGGLDIREVMAQRDADVEKIISTIPAGADRFTQIYYINKWLTENNEYNTSVSSSLSAGESFEHPWDSATCISALAG